MLLSLANGEAVQVVDPIKLTLKVLGAKRLTLLYDELASSFAFNFNLCRYTTASRNRGGPLLNHLSAPSTHATSRV
jgi:hypothetical protein